MIEQVIYKNHLNETIEFGKNSIFLNKSDLYDFSWAITSKNNRISALTKGVVKKTIPVVIKCMTVEDGIALRNRLFEVCEKDVLALQHGRLIIGDYYLKCFITGSKKTDYSTHGCYMKATLTIQTDYPQWVHEKLISFRVNGTVVEEDEGEQGAGEKRNFDFNADFPFDYLSPLTNKTLNNTSFTDCNFKLVIYGAAKNPSVYIGGNNYQVSVDIEDGEYLIIDSISKTIQKTTAGGEVVNCFNYRNRESYIFKKIPEGNNAVAWSGDFGFDVILFDERSEPKWT